MKNILLKSALILVGVSITVIGVIAAVEAATPNARVTISAVTTTVTVAPNAVVPAFSTVLRPTTTITDANYSGNNPGVTTVTVAPNASIPSNPAIPAPTTTVIATK